MTSSAKATALTWQQLDKNRWLRSDGKFIARFNWGSYVFLLYKSRHEYEKEAGDFMRFDTLTAAKKGAAEQDNLQPA